MSHEIKDGYTRVTEILKPWNDFGGIPVEILENKRQIGVELHEAIDLHNSCIPCDVREEVQPYFDSYLEWQSASGAKVVANENRYYDDVLKITGQIDVLLKYPESNELVMCDWKTTHTLTPKGRVSWELQGTFYHYLMRQNDVPNIGSKFIFVQLNNKGKMPKTFEFEYTTDNMAICHSALVVYRKYNPLKEG